MLDRLGKEAQQFLGPAETIQAVILAQTIDPRYSLSVASFMDAVRVLAVTERRILVRRSGRSRLTVREVLRALPRKTRIGTAHGL